MEATLSSDLVFMGTYFGNWRLQPNPTNTEVTCFHLCNKLANRQLDVHFEGNRLLKNTAAKLTTRNNILHKLCGTTWADTLCTSALGLVYSSAEYCAPVWMNSAHTKKIDVQLNNTMRTIRSTPTYWLPILSQIPTTGLRRRSALLREYGNISNNPSSLSIATCLIWKQIDPDPEIRQ